MILVNGQAEDRIAVSDRGLQYGDGLFETIAYRNGSFEFLQAHLNRLILGCTTLGINFEQLQQLETEILSVGEQLNQDAVIKVILTRGSGGRGYLASSDMMPTRIVSSHPMPTYPEQHRSNGVVVRFCKHLLSDNAQLAGIKHLNRLDQVLARNEWDDTSIAEGLMTNAQGHVIEGTMSNLFLVLNNTLITPTLTNAGIAGVIRAQLLLLADNYGLNVEQREITRDDIKAADELFVCNSVIGIWPIRLIEQQPYAVGPVTQLLQSLLAKCDK